MNTERASYFTERSYTTSEAENKKDIFEYWKKILGEDTLRVAEKCYGIDLVKVLNSENYVCENNHVMSEMEKVKIELFEKPSNYNYSGFKGEKLAFDNFFIPLINYGIDILKNGTSLFWTDSIIHSTIRRIQMVLSLLEIIHRSIQAILITKSSTNVCHLF